MLGLYEGRDGEGEVGGFGKPRLCAAMRGMIEVLRFDLS